MAVDLTPFKDSLQEHVSVAAAHIHELWVEQLMAGADLDDYRKYMEFAAKVTGANVDPKADANAGLPVFHFHFEPNGVTATVEKPAKPLTLVEEVQAVSEVIGQEIQAAQDAEPVEAQPMAPVQEPEPVDVLADLDALLGGLDD